VSGTNFTSQIDISKPTMVRAFTQDVRLNFRHARDEINILHDMISTGGAGGGIAEAPETGVLYGRRNAAWDAVPSPGIGDAPTDGVLYARRNAAWATVPPPGGGIEEAPTDGAMYGRRNGQWVAIPAGVTGDVDGGTF